MLFRCETCIAVRNRLKDRDLKLEGYLFFIHFEPHEPYINTGHRALIRDEWSPQTIR